MENIESANVVDEQNDEELVNMGMVVAEDEGLSKDSPNPITLLESSWVGR